MASKTTLFSFLKQVRAEGAKVHWPTRRETVISTIFVFVMVLFSAFLLFFADKLVELGVWSIIGLF